MNDELTDLAIKYGSDRHPFSKHSYTPYYYNLFKKKRDKIKKILEIGVGDGKGLFMWRDFFPNAIIYGADNEPARIFNEKNINVFYCDQSSEIGLKGIINVIGDDIDIVIDDASHKPADQVLTCKVLMPLLKKDVIYVIEDVADLSIVKELTEYNLKIPALKRRKARYDDFLIKVTNANV